MSTHDSSGTARAALYRVATAGAFGSRGADAALAQWQRVEAELSPILGAAGFVALFRRCLYLLRTEYPALAAAHEATMQAGDLEPLRHALASLPHTDATATSQALMQALREQLIGLIGAGLTERLLKPATELGAEPSTSEDTPP